MSDNMTAIRLDKEAIDNLLVDYTDDERTVVALASMTFNLLEITGDLANKVAPDSGLDKVFGYMVQDVGGAAVVSTCRLYGIGEERFNELMDVAHKLLAQTRQMALDAHKDQMENGDGQAKVY